MAKPRACIVRQGSSVDSLLHREARALIEAGFDVTVICAISGQLPRRETIDGYQIYRLPPSRQKGSLFRYLYEYLAFFGLASLWLTILHLQRPFALVQISTMPDFLVFATLIPRLLGAKVTLQMYEPMPELWETLYGHRVLVKLLVIIQQLAVRYAHGVFTVTRQLKDTLVARGADPAKIAVILNVPDSQLVRPTKPSPEEGHARPFVLICHGAIEHRYGHDTMLEAVHSLRLTIPDLRLKVLGRGSYLEAFLSMRESLDLQDRVEYLGYVPFTQLLDELSNADVGIVAQKSSPYSNLVHTGKMYDYMHFGKPVIASRLKAVNAYFDDESLCYFEPNDAQDLARAVRYLYENPKERERFARNAGRLYEQYRWETQRTTYVDVSRRVAGLDSNKSS